MITGLDLRLHPGAAAAGHRGLRVRRPRRRSSRPAGCSATWTGIAALELIDARASALTAEHLGVVGARRRRLAAAHRAGRRYGPDRTARRRAGRCGAGRRTRRRRRRGRAAAALAGPRSRRRRARRLRSATEIRCVAAAVGDRRVRRRVRRAGRRTRPRRHPGAVRPHRRGQPAPEHRALRPHRRARADAVLGDDGADRRLRRQRQLRARRGHAASATMSACRAPTPTSPRCAPSRQRSTRPAISTPAVLFGTVAGDDQHRG